MHKRNLINKLESAFPKTMGRQYPDGVIKAGVEVILNTISEAIISGRRIELRSFGVFKINLHEPKLTRNPRTGERHYMGYRQKIAFKPSSALFNFLNKDVGAPLKPYKVRKSIKETLRAYKAMIRKEYELRKKK